MVRRAIALLVVAPVLMFVVPGTAVAGNHAKTFHVTALVSDQPGVAAHTDPNLVNAWGLAAGPNTPWWVADNETEVSTLYSGDGSPIPLVVQVPGNPTGLVFNGGPRFVISDGTHSGPALFLFATESGTIRGWNPAVPPPPFSTQTFVGADRSNVDAIYKGLALAATHAG